MTNRAPRAEACKKTELGKSPVREAPALAAPVLVLVPVPAMDETRERRELMIPWPLVEAEAEDKEAGELEAAPLAAALEDKAGDEPSEEEALAPLTLLLAPPKAEESEAPPAAADPVPVAEGTRSLS